MRPFMGRVDASDGRGENSARRLGVASLDDNRLTEYADFVGLSFIIHSDAPMTILEHKHGIMGTDAIITPSTGTLLPKTYR